MPSNSSDRPGSTRETEVSNAIEKHDLLELQELSLLPGGFGDARAQAWPFLLGVEKVVEDTMTSSSTHQDHRRRESSLSDSWTQPSASSVPTSPEISAMDLQDPYLHDSVTNISSDSTNLNPHPDEHQVELDTNRSFVLYPVENRSMNRRKVLQEDLHDIILGLLRRRPKLRYFQGYHDIITVLFLTLPIESVQPSAEKLSLHRLRDSMGSGLEPLVGQLRVLKRLLRIVDPSYANILERNSPLPYYALSNLLTLFAHDVPTLPLIQHVFDWILCREPIAAIWLAAAVILSRKEDVLALEREGDEAMGMMHAVLSALPLLSEGETTPGDSHPENADLQVSDLAMSSPLGNDSLVDMHNGKNEGELKDKSSLASDMTAESGEEKGPSHAFDEERESRETTDEKVALGSELLSESWKTDSIRASSSPVIVPPVESKSGPGSRDVLTGTADGESNANIPEAALETDTTPSRARTHSSSRSRSHSRSLPGGYKEKPPIPALPLHTLLRRASDLFAAYPPSSPALRLTETFGSQSALRTWDLATPGALSPLNDEEAEACVGGDNVVLPLSQEEQEEEFGPPRKAKAVDRAPGKGTGRKARSIRLPNGVVVHRQTVVAGVVLLLGVAVALYGFGPGVRSAGRNPHGRFGNGQVRWVAAWVGGLLGVGERLGVGM